MTMPSRKLRSVVVEETLDPAPLIIARTLEESGLLSEKRAAKVARFHNPCITPIENLFGRNVGAKMAKVAVRTKKAPVRRAWSKDDLRLLRSMARKEPLPKFAKALK